MNEVTQYAELVKPFWAPPSWLFAPVWTVLYLIIIVSFGSVFYKAALKQVPWTVALPFMLNVVFNLAFTPIQFGLKNNLLATADVLLVVGTLAWAMTAIYPYGTGDWSVAAVWIANIPYLLWGLFAATLQVTVTYLNRR